MFEQQHFDNKGKNFTDYEMFIQAVLKGDEHTVMKLIKTNDKEKAALLQRQQQ